MRQGFRPSLEPSKQRKAVVEARRPVLCIVLSAVVIVLVFAIFSVSAWNVHEHRFHKNTQNYHFRDEVSLSEVNDDLSATFCNGYTVNRAGPGQVILLSQRAAVNTSYLDPMPVELQQMPFRILNVKTTYLLTGSFVNVTACRERGSSGVDARILLFKGDDNFQKWRKDSTCSDCIRRSVDIPMDDACDNWRERNHIRLEYTVNANDDYFLVIYFGRPQLWGHLNGPGILLTGVIMRTHFDVANAERVCNDTVCYFDLPWGSNKDVVVRFEGFWNNYRSVTTQCEARVAFWVSLFGVLPIVCVIPISALLGWFLCRKTRRNARALRQSQENRKRIRNREGKTNIVVPNEDYGSVAIQEGS